MEKTISTIFITDLKTLSNFPIVPGDCGETGGFELTTHTSVAISTLPVIVDDKPTNISFRAFLKTDNEGKKRVARTGEVKIYQQSREANRKSYLLTHSPEGSISQELGDDGEPVSPAVALPGIDYSDLTKRAWQATVDARDTRVLTAPGSGKQRKGRCLHDITTLHHNL